MEEEFRVTRREFMIGAVLVATDMMLVQGAEVRPDVPASPEAVHKQLLPRVETSRKYTWETFATNYNDFCRFLRNETEDRQPFPIVFEHFFKDAGGYDDEVADAFRRLILVTRKQQVAGFVQHLNEHGDHGIVAPRVSIRPVAEIQFARKQGLGVGARTLVYPKSPHIIRTEFGEDMGEWYPMIGDEGEHEVTSQENYFSHASRAARLLLQMRSFLQMIDTIRYSNTQSTHEDLRFAVPFPQIAEVFRLHRTRAYMPFDMETPEALRDYLIITRNLHVLNSGIVESDRTMNDYEEAVAADMAWNVLGDIPPERVKTELAGMNFYTAFGELDQGALYQGVQKMVQESRLPPIVAPQSSTEKTKEAANPYQTDFPPGLTQAAALDHRQEKAIGADGEPGYLVRLISYYALPDGRISTPRPSELSVATSIPGLTVDENQTYLVAISGSRHYGVFIPQSAFSDGVGLLNGSFLHVAFNTMEEERMFKLPWDFTGYTIGGPRPGVFEPSYNDDAIEQGFAAGLTRSMPDIIDRERGRVEPGGYELTPFTSSLTHPRIDYRQGKLEWRSHDESVVFEAATDPRNLIDYTRGKLPWGTKLAPFRKK